MIKKGDKIPSFELPDQEGVMRKSTEFLGRGKLVMFFYPMDFTPGCTKEACEFRDKYEIFKSRSIQLVGISGDSPESHRRFARKHALPYPLLSDRGARVRKQFGIKKLMGLIPARITFIVDENGTVLHVFKSLFEYENHVLEALESTKGEDKGL